MDLSYLNIFLILVLIYYIIGLFVYIYIYSKKNKTQQNIINLSEMEYNLLS
jgi:hypothetical protein